MSKILPIIASPRERRLWILTPVVVVAIYGTLGLAQSLSVAIRGTGLSTILFITGCLLVLVAVVTQGLKKRPSGAELGVAIGIVATYLFVFVRMASPFERSHIVEYGIVSILVLEALQERRSQGRRVPIPPLLAIAVTSLVGAIDEGIQAVIPSRVFDVRDIFFNCMAAVMAVASMLALRWVRLKIHSRKD